MTNLELPGIPKLRTGKVREVFDLGENLLLVATDRISAFDCILPNPIPRKGEVLTTLAEFWFEKLDFVPNHVVSTDLKRYADRLGDAMQDLLGRSMIVRKAQPLPVECVVRGYLAGSGWKEYQETGGVCGIRLPEGLEQASRLESPIFTPSTKATSGHDEGITWAQCRSLLGDEVSLLLRRWSIELYEHGRAYAASRGIIIADTKFEFGILDGEVILIDEVLTPDSSRFWPQDQYEVGKSPPSFDKQFVRDYLDTLDWDKLPPAPSLPDDVVTATSAKYQEALSRLTGRRLRDA